MFYLHARRWVIEQFVRNQCSLFERFPVSSPDTDSQKEGVGCSFSSYLTNETGWLAMAAKWKHLTAKKQFDISAWSSPNHMLPGNVTIVRNLLQHQSADSLIVLARHNSGDVNCDDNFFVIKCSRLTERGFSLEGFQQLVQFSQPRSIYTAYQSLAKRFNICLDPNLKNIILHEALQEVVAYSCLSQYISDAMYGYAFIQDLQGCWWVMIALKYYPSGTLHDYVYRAQPTPQTMAAILKQANLLRYQGQCRWSHNDFKCDNIMITPTQEQFIQMKDKTGNIIHVETGGVELHPIDFAWSTIQVSESLRITSRAPLEFLTQPMCLENDNMDMAQLITSICRIYPPCVNQTRINKRTPLPRWYFGDSFYDQLSWETVSIEVSDEKIEDEKDNTCNEHSQ